MKRIFISYSHQDAEWMRRLTTQLKVLEMEDICATWVDTDIETGTDWEPAIRKALDEAHVIVMIISAESLVSPFIRGVEVPRALERRQTGGAWVIPVLVKPCAWETVDWLKRMQMVPGEGACLSGLSEHDAEAALAELAKKIAAKVNYNAPPREEIPYEPLPTEHVFDSLPVTGKTLFGRAESLALLDAAWADGHRHLVTFIAWGGVGKTALINRWLMDMEKQNYGGADRVYGWSFYSQGAAEGKQASADAFLQAALDWFGDPDPKAGDGVDKGRRLAVLVKKQKTLLVLDGLEPLQYPPGKDHGMAGKLKDPGLRAFLRQLSMGMNGLCIVTSRQTVTDLSDRTDHTVKEIPLEHLGDEAGADLLESLGATGRRKEIIAAVREYGGHALALTLLGKFVKTMFDGNIQKRDKLPPLTAEKEKGGHARRVMTAYEDHLGESPERNILYLLGLFDRPVEPGALEALKAEPIINGVTDRLRGILDLDLRYALATLRGAGLLAEEDPDRPGGLDCHPLVREHFAERLQQEIPGGWTEANKRLYHYYKDSPEKKLPDTLPEMEPLFAAVAHGCRAGLHNDALVDVYHTRIRRENEDYLVHKLGAFGADLAALSHFFETPWRTPAGNLTPEYQAVVLSWAAFRLRAVGRLPEAVQPMKAGLEASESLENWAECARIAGNLSALLLTLGETAEAVRYGRRSVQWADQSGDDFEMESDRTTLADALLQAGRGGEAETWFREAEAMQQKRQPEFKYLYGLAGHQFCDLLLDRGDTEEVIRRAEQTLEWVTQQGWLLHIALDTLTLGRARLTGPVPDITAAMTFLDRAVTGLREAGTQHWLPPALLARAAAHRLNRAFGKAREDLEETLEIITSGHMKLFLVDYHLETARLMQAQGRKEEAKAAFKEAARLVEETGYERRSREVKR